MTLSHGGKLIENPVSVSNILNNYFIGAAEKDCTAEDAC